MKAPQLNTQMFNETFCKSWGEVTFIGQSISLAQHAWKHLKIHPSAFKCVFQSVPWLRHLGAGL